MDAPQTFYFVRHGETDWNLDNKFQGQNDIPLNATGKEQATLTARRLATNEIGVIFCSRLTRARETAEIFLAGFSKTTRLEVIPELGECSSEVTARLIYSGLGRTHFPCFSKASDGDETPAQFINRIGLGLQVALTNGEENAVIPLIVAHGGTYWAICQILNVEPKDIPNCLPIKFQKIGSTWGQEIFWT